MMDTLFKQQLNALLELKKAKPLSGTIYVFIGAGDANLLKSIRTSIPASSPLLYVYTNPGSNAADFIRTAENSPVTIAIAYGGKTMEQCVLAVNCLKASDLKISCTQGLELNEPDFPAQLHELLENTVIGLNHEKISRLANLRCAIRNLPAISRNHGAEFKVQSGTAVICGSGPSLKNQLEYIKNIRKNIYLIAIGMTAERLFREGIYADAMVFVDNDGHGLSWRRVFSTANPLLISFPTAAPEVAACAENIIFGRGPSPFFYQAAREWKLELPTLNFAGTGTVTALDFAKRAGFEHICLIGNDLCLGPDGEAHISAYDREEKFIHNKLTVTGSNGGQVITSTEFNNLRLHIENCINTLNTTIYNCTPGGAAIKGCTYMDFDTFINKFATMEPQTRFIPGKIPVPYHWSNHFERCARDHAEHLFEDVPIEGVGEYAGFRRQWIENMSESFIADLKEDFYHPSASGSLKYDSFRKFAIDFTAQSNPEFAAFLQDAHPTHDNEFYICCNLTQYAYIALESAELMIPFTPGYLNMPDVCREELEAFLKAHDFSPSKHTLIFIEPASWMHVVALGQLYPQAQTMCLVLWPELFSELISRCMFLHRVPPSTVIAGVSDALPQWRKIYHKTVRDWRRAGLTPLFFENPYAANLPELKAVHDKLP
ncbi:MAG: DUF115 domain-containing protein [Victivallales bacterium]|nr:DUF115 domain-containing protein [Victivallales bacterium]